MHDPEFHDNAPDFIIAGEEEEVRPDIWQRLTKVFEVIVYLLLMAVIAKLFWPEIERQRELKAQLVEVRAQREAREMDVAGLRNEHSWLKSDREYLESVARDRLDMARENEYIIRIEQEPAAELKR